MDLRFSRYRSDQCTEVRFASFLSSGFITAAIVVNPPEGRLAKRTFVQWLDLVPVHKNPILNGVWYEKKLDLFDH